MSLLTSDSKSARDKELLNLHKITNIVNLISHKVENTFPEDFEYLSLKMGDRPGFSILHSALLVIEYID